MPELSLPVIEISIVSSVTALREETHCRDPPPHTRVPDENFSIVKCIKMAIDHQKLTYLFDLYNKLEICVSLKLTLSQGPEMKS